MKKHDRFFYILQTYQSNKKLAKKLDKLIEKMGSKVAAAGALGVTRQTLDNLLESGSLYLKQLQRYHERLDKLLK